MKVKEKNFISAVVYTHNAEKRIDKFLRTIIEFLEDNFEHTEIICVNDNSSDGTVNVIRGLSSTAKNTSISVVNLSYYHGIESAMAAGIDISIGDFVFEFDNTIIDYSIDEIMNVYRRSLEGFDIVSAVPDKKERVSSRLFYSIFDRFTDLSYKMHTESFRILSRRVINRISSMNTMVPYRKAVYTTQGLKIDSIRYKSIGASSYKEDRLERGYRTDLALDSLILFTNIGFKFSVFMTVMMMLISVFMIVYSIIIYATANPVAGWTTTILFLSVGFFGLFAILTIVIKYLQLLINLIFKKKHYSYEGIEKLTK